MSEVKKKVGRPKKNDKMIRKYKIVVSLNENEYECVKNKANKMNLSEFLRISLLTHFDYKD